MQTSTGARPVSAMDVMKARQRLVLWLSLLPSVSAHGKLLCPKPRQYRNAAPIGWTHWQGITIPGDGSFAPGERNANNLNAGIGGGVANEFGAQAGSHGICGDIGSRKGFTAPSMYGPEPARGTFVAGGTMRVQAAITAWHAGWFEFRLGVPSDGGTDMSVPMTQDLLNEHVLEIDASTPDYPAVVNYAGMLGYNGINGGWYKCLRSGGQPWPTDALPDQGHIDTTSSTPQRVWPHGTCCNSGGACSDPAANTDRYIVEFASSHSTTGDSFYDIVLKLPAGVTCERCVLQWTYQTANSRETYPEVFWNCADVAIKPAGYTAATGCDVPGPVGGGGAVIGGGGTSPPPPSGAPGSSTVSSPVGFCGTEWSDYSGGQTAACVPCASAADCPTNRGCWGSTWCREGVLCGSSEVDECAGVVSPPPPHPPPLPPGIIASPSPSPVGRPPPTSDMCGPSSELACSSVDAPTLLESCDAFTEACTSWCGSCDGELAEACVASPATTTTTTTGYCATCECGASDPAFPLGTVINRCTCACTANHTSCPTITTTCNFAHALPASPPFAPGVSAPSSRQPEANGVSPSTAPCVPLWSLWAAIGAAAVLFVVGIVVGRACTCCRRAAVPPPVQAALQRAKSATRANSYRNQREEDVELNVGEHEPPSAPRR